MFSRNKKRKERNNYIIIPSQPFNILLELIEKTACIMEATF